MPVRPEKPVVVYGISIHHDACASRPGMAWTNILSRKLDNPVNEQRVKKLNLKIVRIAGENNVGYADFGNVLMDDFGKIDESLFTDGLHPNENGYRKLSEVLKQYLVK